MPSFSKNTRLILLSILLALVSFIIGQNWVVVTGFVARNFPRLPFDASGVEDYVEDHQFIFGLVCAGISASIVPLFFAGKKLFKYLQTNSIIEIVFNEEEAVHIVASHLTIRSFDSLYATKTIVIPSNAPLLPSHTAMSIGVLSNFARFCYGEDKPILLHFDTDNWGAQNHSFISVGGPFTNRIAKEFFDDNLIAGLSVGEPLSFIDEQDSFEAIRATSAADAAVVKDYGVFIFMENPHDRNKSSLLIFGLWPQGALAAVSLLLNPKRSSDKKISVLRKSIKKRVNILAIVEVKVRNLVFESVDIVKTRTF